MGSMHLMRNYVGGFLASLAVFAFAMPARAVETVAPLKVCLVSGSLEYNSNESLAGFQKYLESRYKAECSRAFVEGENISNLPGLENLGSCDVMLLFTRRLKLEGEQLER